MLGLKSTWAIPTYGPYEVAGLWWWWWTSLHMQLYPWGWHTPQTATWCVLGAESSERKVGHSGIFCSSKQTFTCWSSEIMKRTLTSSVRKRAALYFLLWSLLSSSPPNQCALDIKFISRSAAPESHASGTNNKSFTWPKKPDKKKLVRLCWVTAAKPKDCWNLPLCNQVDSLQLNWACQLQLHWPFVSWADFIAAGHAHGRQADYTWA